MVGASVRIESLRGAQFHAISPADAGRPAAAPERKAQDRKELRMTSTAHFILYVEDQERSTRFHATVLATAPRLDVPGMTEFALPGGAVLGLMPEASIVRLLGPALPDPAAARGVPRAELYLLVPDPAAYHARAIAAGARELSPLRSRSWGHVAAYSIDPDGHVIAFAAEDVAKQR